MDSIYSGIYSYWPFNETYASGSRRDYVGGRDFQNFGTYSYFSTPSGLIGNCLGKHYSYGGPGEGTIHPTYVFSEGDYPSNKSLALTTWTKHDNNYFGTSLLDNVTASGNFGSKGLWFPWSLFYSNTHNLSGLVTFRIHDSNNEIGLSGAIQSNTWHFIAVNYDYDNNYAELSVDNTYFASGTVLHKASPGSGLSRLGLQHPTDFLSSGNNVYIDETSLWTRTLTRSELSYLYNGGSGVSLSFSGVPYDNSLYLFTHGHDNYSGGLPLYSYGHQDATSGIPLYLLPFGDLSSGTIPLVTHGHSPISSGTDLYVYGLGFLNSGFNLYTRGSGSTVSVADSLCAYWPLSETTGTRYDVVGLHHHAPVGLVTAVAGKVGVAASFGENPSDKLTTPSDATLQTGQKSFTFATWLEIGSVDEKTIVSKRVGAVGEWELRASTSAIKFVFDDGQERILTLNGPFAVGERHYVSCRINHGTKTAYLKIDDQASESLAFTGNTISNDEPLVFTYSYYPRLDFSIAANSQYLGVL